MPYKDKEDKLESQRRWYQRNKEKKAQFVRAYREKANPDKLKQWEYNSNNSDKRKEWNKKYREKNKEKLYKLRREIHLKTKYGITQADYDQLLQAQANNCALCRESLKDEKKICIDHCHTSKKIRGLIHHKCNVLLGFTEDKIELLEKAINYLKSND